MGSLSPPGMHPRFVEREWWRENPETGCWDWQLNISILGYGRIWAEGKRHQAHRYVYESLIGPVPDGLDLDHLCRDRACVNPAHLEPVTRLENVRRGACPLGTRWSRCAEACVDCGTTERGHVGHGRCTRCFIRWKRLLRAGVVSEHNVVPGPASVSPAEKHLDEPFAPEPVSTDGQAAG